MLKVRICGVKNVIMKTFWLYIFTCLTESAIITIIIIIIISFMQGIYTYIPETNCVPKEYSVAAVLLLLFMVLISLVSVLNLLYFRISPFRSIIIIIIIITMFFC